MGMLTQIRFWIAGSSEAYNIRAILMEEFKSRQNTSFALILVWFLAELGMGVGVVCEQYNITF